MSAGPPTDDSGAPEEGGPLSDSELAARREALARKIAEQRRRQPVPPGAGQPGGSMRGMAEGLKLASEFIAGVLVGAGIGYAIDYVAGTAPFGLIVLLMFGFAAGVLNVMRSVRPGGKKGPPPAPGTDA
ncbi:AtpZ/AtpI family protein [Aurantimonas sp. Leaf443]|uniref:AtpZ/AtpI family protein n=1 Tax=Aurantimonas sp. Leaf443 TaxID=1736378 RepID=UPI0006F77438|nr:AtpZ/AtpI family protein [Aurantimonas sp. Leaf443]KQT88022.1 hypothetical protein ASG48_00775 [Aurantimonas sp. Leaf443]